LTSPASNLWLKFKTGVTNVKGNAATWTEIIHL